MAEVAVTVNYTTNPHPKATAATALEAAVVCYPLCQLFSVLED